MGGSFSSGFSAGSKVAGDWIDSYKKNKEEEITNKLFVAYDDLHKDEMQQNAEGEEMQREAFDFTNASPDDIAGASLREFAANGGKVDDQTVALAYGFGSKVGEVKSKFAAHQEKQELLRARAENLNMVSNSRKQYLDAKTAKVNISGSYGSKNSKRSVIPRKEDGTIDHEALAMNKNIPSDVRRTSFSNVGVNGTAAPVSHKPAGTGTKRSVTVKDTSGSTDSWKNHDH